MKVQFEEVLKQFYLYNNIEEKHVENTNGEAQSNLVLANELLGEWYKVFLKRKDILQVILPWHIGEGGKMELIPKLGGNVEEVVRKLQNIKEFYEQENPICWSKISLLSKMSLTPIYLSTKAIDTEDYKYVNRKERLIHLDGLHRMVSWELNNLLTENVSIETYIAGPLNHLG